ncbi:protein phosphatase methylesterase 1 [Marchantia polymorpha subsp. ruderalis]|uniref:Protein phosphatase methylesterase 1 n=2 Tax=Marchantia polymorpha TaxID=3197 RepID=A0AAF6AWV5_MARPO|nr:hypothetical protein MARPO_0007s0278 [Marchantia polymorpha]BBN04239.1 hypothetical protein Mp_3g02900 [Marchantia polymorpha subsp. ruderalis]|eukprot:PTQ47925.1 hypothetical protein MARPO_0007s0278 [Marchantia polymorpha]
MERVPKSQEDIGVESSTLGTFMLSLDDPIMEEGEQSEDTSTGERSVFAPSSIPPRPFREPATSKYAPLPWEGHFDQEQNITIPATGEVFHVYVAGSQGPVVFCLHGGGYSGLSFALAAGKMKDKVRVVAMDMRGHGQTRTNNDADLSAETLCSDVVSVINTMFSQAPPAIILIGHSMGGAIAVRVAAQRVLATLAGVVVVDVVEGTAMASLMHMQKILSSRQMHFQSPDQAIIWSVKGGGALRNIESARISVPSTLMFDNEKQCYVWRTPLQDSEAYWRGWYEGLSEAFLSCPVAKLLLLAGTDRLDRSLTIGQMQGKFQMIVVRHSGHAIQEDEPDEFTAAVLSFIARNRIGTYGMEIPGLRRPIQLRSSN